jgi:putative regulator of septum formation
MSSKVTGDAQSDAGTGGEADHTLPTEIVENSAGTGAGAVAVADSAEPTADSAPAESEQGPPAASGPDEPTAALDAAEPADGAESGELSPAGEDRAEDADGAWDEDEEPGNRAELSEPAEPTELISMSEPVELAEPVEMRRPPRRHWQTAAIAFGFLVAAVAIVVGAIAIVGSLTHGFKKPVIIHYKKSAIFSLKTGECINPNGQTATVVSCAAPHDAEVFATFELPGSKWPGTAAVGTAASSECSTRLNGYLNPQLAISLKSTYIYPDSVAWQAGTRTVICEVRATNGQLTGSVRGATATAS